MTESKHKITTLIHISKEYTTTENIRKERWKKHKLKKENHPLNEPSDLSMSVASVAVSSSHVYSKLLSLETGAPSRGRRIKQDSIVLNRQLGSWELAKCHCLLSLLSGKKGHLPDHHWGKGVLHSAIGRKMASKYSLFKYKYYCYNTDIFILKCMKKQTKIWTASTGVQRVYFSHFITMTRTSVCTPLKF